MMGHKEKLKGGDEHDAFTKWRHYLIWNTSSRRKIKKMFTRRIRRTFKIKDTDY